MRIGPDKHDLLLLSRTIASKPWPGVTCLPEIKCGACENSRSYLLLLTDGVTDKLGEQQIKEGNRATLRLAA